MERFLENPLEIKKRHKQNGVGKGANDESLVEVVVDLSGRPYFVLNNEEILPHVIFGEERDIWREFFLSHLQIMQK